MNKNWFVLSQYLCCFHLSFPTGKSCGSAPLLSTFIYLRVVLKNLGKLFLMKHTFPNKYQMSNPYHEIEDQATSSLKWKNSVIISASSLALPSAIKHFPTVIKDFLNFNINYNGSVGSSMKWRQVRGNLFTCKLFSQH